MKLNIRALSTAQRGVVAAGMSIALGAAVAAHPVAEAQTGYGYGGYAGADAWGQGWNQGWGQTWDPSWGQGAYAGSAQSGATQSGAAQSGSASSGSTQSGQSQSGQSQSGQDKGSAAAKEKKRKNSAKYKAALANWPATTEDLGLSITGVPSETTMAVVTPKGIAKTGNADEPRPGLSVMKMYIADYVLKSGDKSGTDWYLTQKMLRVSDDDAANKLYKKYPEAITKTAKRYGLSNTVDGKKWGTSWTSATDAAIFLDHLRKHSPDSPVLFWMGTAAPVASDGTHQDWGTAQLPGAEGTKWGWSDYGQTAVSSASYGANYTAAAFTWGGPKKQTKDVKSARPQAW